MTTTFTRRQMTSAQFAALQYKDRLTAAERHDLCTAEIVDAPDENAASIATMAGFLAEIGGAK
jgi:hypothetical protein